MDLSSLKPVKANDGATLQILHPDSQDPIEGMTVTLLGQDSDVYRKIQLGKQQAALNRIAKGKRAVDMKAEKLREDSIAEMVKLTVDWTGFELEGETLDCTPENVAMVYEGWEWLFEQVTEFVADRANFFQ